MICLILENYWVCNRDNVVVTTVVSLCNILIYKNVVHFPHMKP